MDSVCRGLCPPRRLSCLPTAGGSGTPGFPLFFLRTNGPASVRVLRCEGHVLTDAVVGKDLMPCAVVPIHRRRPDCRCGAVRGARRHIAGPAEPAGRRAQQGVNCDLREWYCRSVTSESETRICTVTSRGYIHRLPCTSATQDRDLKSIHWYICRRKKSTMGLFRCCPLLQKNL